jgi:hypothetical protein
MLNVGVHKPYRFSHKENIGETPESDIMKYYTLMLVFVQCQEVQNE